ncbi:MAG: hypothetical protein P8P74_12365 [Crocinitomicaceae bacterium]|nr:hypothetical protein [Crocinitomicaceae bacterium]
MEEKNDIFDHLKPRKTPIPDASYFEALANSVIESQKEKAPAAPKETKIIPLYKRPSLWIGAVAAVFIAGILIINFNETTEIDSDPLLALNDVSSNDVYEYIDENIEDFETDLIVEALNESTVNEMSFVEPETTESAPEETKIITSEPVSFDQIDSDDILDYFNEEGIDSEDFEDDSFI